MLTFIDRLGRAFLALAVIGGFATLVRAALLGNGLAVAALAGMAAFAAMACVLACVRAGQVRHYQAVQAENREP
jgi:hypothetical protein